MENDNTQELELTEIEENVEDTENSTTEETVDYKALYEEERSRANKLKRKLYTKDAPIIKNKPQELDDDTVQTVKRLEVIENKRQFGFENSLSPEETDAVFKFANGKPSKETLEHPFIKAGIESLRTQKRVESNTPSSSQRSSTFGGKSFTELSEDERKNAFESRVKSAK